MDRKTKTAKQLERHFKGVANHWRLQILALVAERKEGITLENIAEELGGNMKTISEHTRRLHHAGLIDKEYRGREVVHTPSPYGRLFLKFITTFSHS